MVQFSRRTCSRPGVQCLAGRLSLLQPHLCPQLIPARIHCYDEGILHKAGSLSSVKTTAEHEIVQKTQESMYVCMYVCMYVVCMYVCSMYVCMYVYMCVRMYVCIYVCMCVCTYVCTVKLLYNELPQNCWDGSPYQGLGPIYMYPDTLVNIYF